MKKILYIFAMLCCFTVSTQAANSRNLVEKKNTVLSLKNSIVKKTYFDRICGSGSVEVGNSTIYWMTFCHDDGTTATYVTVVHHNEP